MNYAELVDAVAAKTSQPKKLVQEVLDAASSAKVDALRSGDDVRVKDFGTYKVVRSEQRKGRNPATGEQITIAASKKVKFIPITTLKTIINR